MLYCVLSPQLLMTVSPTVCVYPDVIEMFALCLVITEDCNFFLFLHIHGMENFCDSETNQSVVLTGALDSDKMVLECHLSLLYSLSLCLFYVWYWMSIEYEYEPIPWNHQSCKGDKHSPTFYGNCT